MGLLKRKLKALVPSRFLPAIHSVVYAGNRVVCPCCGGHFRKFLNAGVIDRAGAMCPRCGSLERHRLLRLYLENKTNIFSDRLKVLHFAPEVCLQEHLGGQANLDYVSADLEAPLAAVKMDITDIPCEDDSFDAVICSHVLEHVCDDGKAMRELCRVVKPGGWAIILVPDFPFGIRRDETYEDANVVTSEDRARAYGQADHVRVYGRDVKDRLEDAGFSVRVYNYPEELGEESAKRYGLNLGECVYFCTRRA